MDRRALQDLLAVFSASAGLLAYEVALTRIFTLIYWHHFAGLLISLALIGFGTAGSLTSLTLTALEKHRRQALAWSALAAAILMAPAYLSTLAVDLEPLALAWSTKAWRDLFLVIIILIIPFLFGAAHIGLRLAWAEKVHQVYAANLAGSAAGCLTAALAMNLSAPPQAVYPAVFLMLIAAALSFSFNRRYALRVGLLLLGLGLLFIYLLPLPLKFAAFKDRSAVLAAQGSRVETQASSLHGLVEVIGGPAFHFAPGLSLNCREPLPEQRGLFLDGDLIGPVTKLDTPSGAPAFTGCSLAGLPINVFKPKRVLVVNPSGGLNLLGFLSTSTEVLALEGNPLVYNLMTSPWAAFSGNLYSRPGIQVRSIDPANFFEASRENSDLIVVSHCKF
ncbi:MAG: hypothetical protein HQK55_17050 [Deltaproteobacteria bacterium]|nr:hypothetical protein [Deltaproteobacteria bacterium]